LSRDRCILSIKYVPAGSAKRLGGFLRYVQFRDQHADLASTMKLDGLTRYITHRDRTAPGGRLFGPRGNAGDLDRRALLAHIARSMRHGGSGKHPRAAYRFVLSPERPDGLDLKELTRAVMTQLSQDAGGVAPWIAAIHRNTRHPHVHIVMAARREIEPGRFRTVVINRERLARMKVALNNELVRERGGASKRVSLREFTPIEPEREHVRPQWRHSLGVFATLGQSIERGLRGIAAQQRRVLREWAEEEERRLREEWQRRPIRSHQFER
jgi:hypothetical protein